MPDKNQVSPNAGQYTAESVGQNQRPRPNFLSKSNIFVSYCSERDLGLPHGKTREPEEKVT